MSESLQSPSLPNAAQEFIDSLRQQSVIWMACATNDRSEICLSLVWRKEHFPLGASAIKLCLQPDASAELPAGFKLADHGNAAALHFTGEFTPVVDELLRQTVSAAAVQRS